MSVVRISALKTVDRARGLEHSQGCNTCVRRRARLYARPKRSGCGRLVWRRYAV